MFDFSDVTIKERALAAGRRIFCRVTISAPDDSVEDHIYTSEDSIVSLAVDIGAASGGFKIGAAYSGKLTVRLMGDVSVSQYDRISVSVGFYTAEGGTGNVLPLGVFWVDRVAFGDNIITVTAYDKMLRAAKNYKSALTFPCAATAVLDELCQQMTVALATDFTEPAYDPQISELPTKGTDAEGKPIYYTRREALSYLGSLFGGNWYFNTRGLLALTKFKKVTDVFAAENSIKLDVSDTPFLVTGVAWNKSGVTICRDPDIDALGMVEFSNPISVEASEPVMHALEERLIGLSYYNGIVERQGCGWFELGDIVDAYDAQGNIFPILITGINYTIADGAFTEKIYSTALTESESNYTSGDIEGQTKPPSSSGDSGTGGDTIENAIIIEEKSVRHLIHSYTTVGYFHGNKLVYAGVQNQVVCNGAVFHASSSAPAAAIEYGSLSFERANYDGTVQSVAISIAIDTYNEQSKVYNCGIFINGNRAGSFATKSLTFGFQCKYSTLVSSQRAGSDYPYGYVSGAIYIVYYNSNNDNITSTLISGIGAFGFISIDEYNSAVGLTTEPVFGETVEETVTTE